MRLLLLLADQGASFPPHRMGDPHMSEANRFDTNPDTPAESAKSAPYEESGFMFAGYGAVVHSHAKLPQVERDAAAAIAFSGLVSSKSDPSKECSCMVCLMLDNHYIPSFGPVRFQDLSPIDQMGIDKKHRELRHFRYLCKDNDCRYLSKHLPDLRRHCKSKHCKKPLEHKCHFIGCKYRDIEFARADKLKSHLRSAHKGMPVPSKHLHAIQPKPNRSA